MQVHSWIPRFLFLLSIATALGACRSTGDKKGGEAAAATSTSPLAESLASAPTTLPVGVVHLVDESARFVLIRSTRGLQLEPGTVLTLHGDQGQASARVKVSPARKGAFLTADFLDGIPVKGQQVTTDYQRPTPDAGAAPAFPDFSDPNAVQVLE